MLKRIQVLEDGRVRQRRQEAGGLKDHREELREKSIRGFLNKFEMEGCIAQKGLQDREEERVTKGRG